MTQFSVKKKNALFCLKSILRQTCFSPLWPPITHPTTHPLDYRVGGTERREGALIMVKKQVDFKIHFRWFKAFLDQLLFYFFFIKGAGWLDPDPKWKIPLTFFWNCPLTCHSWLIILNMSHLTSHYWHVNLDMQL